MGWKSINLITGEKIVRPLTSNSWVSSKKMILCDVYELFVPKIDESSQKKLELRN
jgi:hypothetical protein